MTKRFASKIALLFVPVAVLALFAFLVTSQQGSGTRVGAAVNNPGFVPRGTWSDLPSFPTVTGLVFCDSGCGGIGDRNGPILLKRAGAAAYPPNGKIYILGGRHRADQDDITSPYIWEYTPGNTSYVRKNALLENGGYGSRYESNMAVATLTDTNGVRIYLVGGSSVDNTATNMVRVYNPNTDTITTLGSQDNWPATPVHTPGGYAVYNNKLYIFGGYNPAYYTGPNGIFSDTWVFDPMAAVGSKWSQIASASLSLARTDIAGAELDGYIYAVGGDVITDTFTTVVTSTVTAQGIVERMNPSDTSPTWQAVASLPSARGNSAVWAYDTGTGYEISGHIVVGSGGYLSPDAKSYIYDPVSNTWSDFVPMTRPRRNTAYTQYLGILYAFAGYNITPQGTYDGSNDAMAYDASGPAATNTPVVATNTPTTPPTNTPPPTNTRTNTPPPTYTPTNPPTSTPGLPSATPTSTACPLEFTDVPPTNPFYTYIRCLACRGIVSGYTTSPPCPSGQVPCFLSGNFVTRGQMAKFVANAAGYSDIIPPTQQTFTDVLTSSTFWLYIERAYAHGVIQGYIDSGHCPGGTPCFLAGNNVTRGQAAKFVSIAAGYSDVIPPNQQTFTDVLTGNAFWVYIERVFLHGVIQGYTTSPPCTTGTPCYLPGNNVSRGQTAKFISNAFYPDCQTPRKK